MDTFLRSLKMEPITPSYLVEQPKSLEYMAIEELRKWITSQTEQLLSLIISTERNERLISRQIETTLNYLKTCLPRRFHDTLSIHAILRALANLRERMQLFDQSKRETGKIIPCKSNRADDRNSIYQTPNQSTINHVGAPRQSNYRGPFQPFQDHQFFSS